MLLLLAAACSDHNPAVAPPPALPPSTVAAVTCTVSVPAGTLACASPGAGSGASAAILGGQGTQVRLRSTGMSYDDSATFRMDVTVENLTGQALGTADGVTPSPEGVRVFFHSGPTASGGQGEVAVANADGEGFFITAGQKYFQYDGILAPGDTTAAREWRFTLPSTVTSFAFSVYVAGPVRAEAGWVSLAPLAPWIQVGDTMHLDAVVRNAAGRPVDGAAVAWSSSNPAVATVDSLGVLTAVGAGASTVTATSGGRTGRVGVRVSAQGAAPHASIHGLEILGASVTADEADSVAFEVGVRTTPWEVYHVGLRLLHADGERRSCDIQSPGRPTAWGAVYRCVLRFPAGSPTGVWRVDSLTVTMRKDNVYSGSQLVTTARLNAAGAPAHVYVEPEPQDVTPPTLLDFAFFPDSVVAGVDLLQLYVRAPDAQSGLARAGVVFRSEGNPRVGCVTSVFVDESLLRCPILIPWYHDGGTWTVDLVWVEDQAGNRDTTATAALQAAGFPTQLEVTSTNPDNLRPDIAAFTVSRDTVVANGVDSVTITLTATEPPEGSGVQYLEVGLEKYGDPSRTVKCSLSSSGTVFTQTMTCTRTFMAADAGGWRVRHVVAFDRAGNGRVLLPEDLQAAGYPTELIVTAP